MCENPFTGAVWPGLCRYIKGRGRSILLNFLRTNLPVLNAAMYLCIMCTALLCDCILDVRAKIKRRLPISGHAVVSWVCRRAKLSTVNRTCWPSISTESSIEDNNIRRGPLTPNRYNHAYPNYTRIRIWRRYR